MVAPAVIGALGGAQALGAALGMNAQKDAERARQQAFIASEKRINRAYGESSKDIGSAYEGASAQRKDVAGRIGQQAEQTYAAQNELWAPWMVPGLDAYNQLHTLMTDPNAYSAAFQQYASSPQFQFKMDEATKAMRRQASVAGNRFGGAQMSALSDRAEQVAGTEFNSWLDRLTTGLSSLANTGLQATSALGNAQSQLGNQKLGALQYGDTSALDIDKAQQINSLRLGRAQDVSNLQMGAAASSANSALAKSQLQTGLINQLAGLGGMAMGGGAGIGALTSGFGTMANNSLGQAEGFTGGALSGPMRVA